ncbi:Pentatricopeptide repeat-containing protein At4g13650 [Linum perenne]
MPKFLPVIQSSSSLAPFFSAKFRSSATCIATGLQQHTSSFYSAKKPPRESPITVSDATSRRYGGKFDFSKERLKQYSAMLRACTSKTALNEGRAVHGNLVRSGVVPDSHLWVSLTSFYAKCGRLDFAREVLDEMPERDVVSWTALISGFVSKGCGDDAVGLYCVMRNEDVRPNEYLLATMMKACALCLDVELGKQVHAEVVKVGLLSDLFVASGLVDLYSKCGDIEVADTVFVSISEKNEVLWNVMINAYAEIGDVKAVFKLFSQMIVWDNKINKYSLSIVLKGCANSGNLEQGKVLHCIVIKTGYELDEFANSCLVDMYSKCGMASDGLKVFNGIKDPDVVVWSAITSSLDRHGFSHDAAELYKKMLLAGVEPNQYIFSSLVSTATSIRNLHFGEGIHGSIRKSGFENDVLVSNALIMMYMKHGLLEYGIQVFSSMSEHDVESWSYLLSGFCNSKTCEEGPSIFHQMLVKGFKPGIYTFIDILRSCSSLSDVCFGRQVHAHIIKSCNDGDDFVGTALIDMYAKGKCLEDAVIAFNRLVDRDVFTWTVMIDGYTKANQPEKALKCFVEMQSEGVSPNEFTIASCLKGCSHAATLESGQQVHSTVIKAGYSIDVIVATALTDMYGKCGSLEDAESVFNGMIVRDTVSWNTMIAAYSCHCQGENALKAYRMMIDEGFLPDEVTFLSILSVCSNIGLVEEGKKQFESMSKVYGITPSLEHFASMVNILARAGQFNEVEVFIKEHKLSTHALIWETVLAACKMHQNVELGEIAAGKLFELQPKVDSPYVFLSNIYAAKGMWDHVQKTRGLMSAEGVKKEPGCSWLGIDGQVHVFVSRDVSHPKTEEIYAKLEDLKQRLCSVGYVPKVENVLHNLDDIEKIEHLWHHSERLALSLALISTTSQKPIRIFKNLRMCEDCHDVMKNVSDITDREIVIRDFKRFHHQSVQEHETGYFELDPDVLDSISKNSLNALQGEEFKIIVILTDADVDYIRVERDAATAGNDN